MIEKGLVKLAYDHIFIDHGWQGGRVNRNNIIPDLENFSSKRKVITIDQDPLGRQAKRVIKGNGWQVFVKPLQNGESVVGVLNTSNLKRKSKIKLSEIGLTDGFNLKNV